MNYHYDGNGSTRELTDSSEELTDTWIYTGFGETVAGTGTTDNPYQYVGAAQYYFESENAHHYVVHRSYAPYLGRWTSLDPLHSATDVNRYLYAANAPVFRIDPLGLKWQQINKTTWKAECHGESITNLAMKVTNNEKDWVCIWPLGDKWNAYPMAAKGALADVTNLIADSGPTVLMHAPIVVNPKTNTADEFLLAVKAVYTRGSTRKTYMWRGDLDAAAYIRDVSGQGKTPISLAFIGGHHFGNDNLKLGDANKSAMFSAQDLTFASDYFCIDDSNNDARLALARRKIGPPRCWFTRNAVVYGVGCSTNSGWALDWANTVIRRGGTVKGTPQLLNASVDPTDPDAGLYLWMVRGRVAAYTLEELKQLPWVDQQGRA